MVDLERVQTVQRALAEHGVGIGVNTSPDGTVQVGMTAELIIVLAEIAAGYLETKARGEAAGQSVSLPFPPPEEPN